MHLHAGHAGAGAVAAGLTVVIVRNLLQGAGQLPVGRLLQTDIISKEYLEGCYRLGQQYPDLCSSIFLVCEPWRRRPSMWIPRLNILANYVGQLYSALGSSRLLHTCISNTSGCRGVRAGGLPPYAAGLSFMLLDVGPHQPSVDEAARSTVLH